MDLGSIIGLVMGFGLILGANVMEGGKLSSLLQITAAMIVLGGTLGACVLQFPMKVTVKALKSSMSVFFSKKVDLIQVIMQIVEFAKRSRREGILSLEREIDNLKDPFFAKALRMAVDGLEPKQLIETMETELETIEAEHEAPVKFIEAAGGYAPTMGIMGAVLGLMHVMSNLAEPAKLGEGIATAFVATVYGLAAANLVFLPFANKIKTNGHQGMRMHQVVLKGVLLIQEGVNHSIIEEQLKSFLDESERKKFDSARAAAKTA
ncbi:flagellar motor protein [bacterium]|nr:flagellar motor protein [bacterium]